MSKPDANQWGLIGGIEKREIIIVEHDPRWLDVFRHHAQVLVDALGSAAMRIEHIGSTSVPGLAAKPIIDMLVVVQDSASENTYRPQFESAGYVLRVREPDFHEHRMFRTLENDVHVHVISNGSAEIERWLTFRDRLRSNAEDCARYEQIKRKLADRDWPDMNAYADAKSEIVEQIIAKATASEP